MTDFLEIQFFKIAKGLIKRDYGADCPDYDENCASCQAKKTIEWIDGHCDLIRK